jgi:hypothetical protein
MMREIAEEMGTELTEQTSGVFRFKREFVCGSHLLPERDE